MKNLLFFALFSMTISSCSDDNVENQTEDSGLVGEYLFSGNTFDTSGKGHHGVTHGATLTTDRKSNPGSAYVFNGAQYISIENNSDINFSSDQDFSISLWVLINPIQNTESALNDILRKWDGDAQGYSYSISYSNSEASAANVGKILYARYDGSCANVMSSYSPVVTTDQFHHIVFLKQGTKLRQYLDNVLVQEFTDATTCSTANTANLTIGTRGNLVRYFSGKVDDVKIYNRALNISEIDALFKE